MGETCKPLGYKKIIAMKVIQVIPWLRERSSGLTSFMSVFCSRMSKNTDLELVSFSPILSDLFCGVNLRSFAPSVFPLSIVGWSCKMYQYLKDQSAQVDIIHTHSLWTLPNIYPHFASKGRKAKVVIMPHGALSQQALRHSSWKKKIMLLAGQMTALRQADLLIATSQDEYFDLRKFGLKNPIAIIPIGVSTPCLRASQSKKKERGVMVYLSRIHPIKRLDLLIKVWGKLCTVYPDWELKIAGPLDSEYAEQMLTLSKELRSERITFVGEVTGVQKEEFLLSANCFVLPTSSENFGIAIAESLMCGTPVITTKGAPWEGLVTHHAGWWIEPNSEEALIASMSEAMSMSIEELQQMGRHGREWVLAEFSWETVTQKYVEAYRWLLGEEDKPEFIYTE